MLNNFSLMGRLTRDPEIKTTPSGVKVLSFTVACDRNFKNQDGTTTADFIDCVAWRQQAEFINKYFAKGKMIALTGSLQTRTYTDRDGIKRKVYEVNVESVNFAGDTPKKAETAENEAEEPNWDEINEGDLPF